MQRIVSLEYSILDNRHQNYTVSGLQIRFLKTKVIAICCLMFSLKNCLIYYYRLEFISSALKSLFTIDNMIINDFLSHSRVLLNPPTTDPPTTDNLPTDPPTHRLRTYQPTDKILLQRLENVKLYTSVYLNVCNYN